MECETWSVKRKAKKNRSEAFFMISVALGTISTFILFFIERVGYLGVFFLMTLQSVNIPVPSEVTMPFSGFLVQKGVFNFWLVVLTGTLGSLAGSFISYKIGATLMKNGKILKYRWLRIFFDVQSLESSDHWFKKYGAWSVFFGRLVPIVSTFISFPAGIYGMKISTFLFLTLAGSFFWSAGLTWIGFALGENWQILEVYFRKFDYLFFFLIILGAGWWARHRFFHQAILDKNLS